MWSLPLWPASQNGSNQGDSQSWIRRLLLMRYQENFCFLMFQKALIFWFWWRLSLSDFDEDFHFLTSQNGSNQGDSHEYRGCRWWEMPGVLHWENFHFLILNTEGGCRWWEMPGVLQRGNFHFLILLREKTRPPLGALHYKWRKQAIRRKKDVKKDEKKTTKLLWFFFFF